MTKEELDQWFKEAEWVNGSYHESDGNVWEERIYKHSGEFFVLSFCNNRPSSVYGEKGYVKGVYQPTPVTPTERTVKVTYIDYLDKDMRLVTTVRKGQ